MDEKTADGTIENEWWKMRFGLRRSYFYHEKRVLFWRTLLFFTHGIEAALTSTAVAFLFCEGSRTVTQWAVLVSAILSFVAVWFGAEKRIQANMAKKAGFAALEDRIPPQREKWTAELLEEIRRARIALERDDDVVLECVDALARNAACRSFGIPEDKRLNFFERTVGRILPIPYADKTDYPRHILP